MILALIFIAFATILTPPYQVPDERLHYLRTLQLSQYNFSKTPSENLGSREIIVPDNLDDVNYSRAEATDAVTDVGLIGDSMVEGRNIDYTIMIVFLDTKGKTLKLEKYGEVTAGKSIITVM